MAGNTDELGAEKLGAEIDFVRAQAEAQRATARATRDKAEAEVAEIRTPFFMRGAFWTAMIPILTAAGTAIYALNSGYFSSKTEVLKAQTDLLEFKKQTFEAQVAAIQTQIDDKTQELEAARRELAETPLRTLIEILREIDESDELPTSTFGKMVEYVKKSPDVTLGILDSAIDSAATPYQKLVLATVAFVSIGASERFDRMIALGNEAVARPDEARAYSIHFWGLFVGRGVGFALTNEVFRDEHRRKSCELLVAAFTAAAPAATRARLADTVSGHLLSCTPAGEDYRFFKLTADEWKPVAEAAARHFDIAKTSYYTENYAKIVASTNRLAAALLFAAEWEEAGWTPELADNAQSLAEDLAGEGGVAGLPTKEAGVDGWKQFLEAGARTLAVIRSRPIDAWPQT